MTNETGVLLSALEAIGREWADHHLPGDLLLEAANVELLLGVEELVWESTSGLTATTIKQRAPSFFEQFGLAAFRQLGEPFGHPREVAASAMNG